MGAIAVPEVRPSGFPRVCSGPCSDLCVLKVWVIASEQEKRLFRSFEQALEKFSGRSVAGIHAGLSDKSPGSAPGKL